MREILVTAHTDPESKRPVATVMRIDREARSYEALQADGTWRAVGLYEKDTNVFRLSNAAVKESA